MDILEMDSKSTLLMHHSTNMLKSEMRVRRFQSNKKYNNLILPTSCLED